MSDHDSIPAANGSKQITCDQCGMTIPASRRPHHIRSECPETATDGGQQTLDRF
ncbi:hypothetical protein [Halorubrum ezzemoulense]|uniref:hypothetical protein n=1 Tax=Halorubrum ezzemoulense TaxID=337243 RepID=UPI0015C5E65A|nr:hypothetical protein [Halorubrum ezzemoulense]